MNGPRLNRTPMPTYIPSEGVNPLCPYCDTEIDGVYQQRVDMNLGKAYLWFCMECRKTLGVSHRKGFWMG